MKIFSYFTICSMLCCGAFYSENTFGMNNFNAENLVLSKAAAFAENSPDNPAASALMNYVKSKDIGDVKILYRLREKLSAIGYTVTLTPKDNGYTYSLAFNPLKYHQYKNGGAVPQTTMPNSTINAKKKPTIAANRVNTNTANSNNRQLNELKKSIDGLSELIQGLIQSVDELKESINQDNADDIEDDNEETCGVENPED